MEAMRTRGSAVVVVGLILALGGPTRAAPAEGPGPLRLSLADALARALSHNLGAVLGREGVSAAGGARLAALSGLLPNVSGRISDTRQQINLEAFGFPIPKGTDPIVGPFTVFDARVTVTQPLFDLTAIESARAAARAASAAAASYEDVKDAVVAACAGLYLQAAIGGSRVDASRAQLRTAEAVYARAAAMKEAGVVPGIDVLRADVQRQAQQQRLIVLENEHAKQQLALARAIGLPLGQAFELSDGVPYAEVAVRPMDEALAQAYASRSDLKSALELLRAAESSRRAILGEALPSVRVTADYGDIGRTADTSKVTYAVGASVRIPLFQGGRVRGRLIQADAALAQQRAYVDDLRSGIEFEVRAACLDVTAAQQRVTVAAGALGLAEAQLEQARDRFTAGVTSTLEVVQAQEAVAAATENHLSARYAHGLARLSLARASGVAEEMASQFTGGSR